MDGPGGTVCSNMDGPAGPVIAWTIYGATVHQEKGQVNVVQIALMCLKVRVKR